MLFFKAEAEEVIEIGINQSKVRSRTYPQITEYSFPVNEVGEWLYSSFKDGKGDLEFYGSLMNSNSRFTSNNNVVVF